MISLILFIVFMSITPVCFIKFVESSNNQENKKKLGVATATFFGCAILSEIQGSWFGAVCLLLSGGIMYLVSVLCCFLSAKMIEKKQQENMSAIVKGIYRFLITTAFFLLTVTGTISHIYDGVMEVVLTYELTQDNMCLLLWWIPSVTFAIIPSCLLVTDNIGKYGKMLIGYMLVSSVVVMIIGDFSNMVFGGTITQVINVIWETVGSDSYPQNVAIALTTIMNMSSLYVVSLAIGCAVAFVVTLFKYLKNKKGLVVDEKSKVVSVEQMRRADEYTIEHGTSGRELMYRAAKGIYETIDWSGKKIAIVTGSGNNGGDGYALASILAEEGIFAHLYRTSERFSDDGKYYYDRSIELGVYDEIFDRETKLKDYDVIVDCILGTGFKGVPEGVIADAINTINNSDTYVISADINSGLNGDTGEAELAVKSDITVSVGFYKQGLLSENAKKYIGELVNVDIGIVLV